MSAKTDSVLSRLQELAERPAISRLRSALGAEAELHLVGGTLRDAFLGSEIRDIDCATGLNPDEVRRRLERAGIHVVPTGLKHQTVTAVPLEGEAGIEITTFRAAGMNPAGGVFQGTSIAEDLRYRDFTINALAYSLKENRLVDVVEGLGDLEAKLIRAPGKAEERFAEDPLRVLRMVRFSVASGFRIVPETLRAAQQFVPQLPALSIERIRDEFAKILLGDEPARGLRLLVDLGILSLLFPELEPMVGFEQNHFHKADVFEHTLEVVEKTPPDPILRLAALLHDVGKPATLSIDPEDGFRHFFKHEIVGTDITRAFLLRLRFPYAIVDPVCALVETHMRPIEAGPGGLRRLIRDTGEQYSNWRLLKEADASSCKFDPVELARRLATFDAAIEEIRKGPQLSPLRSLALNGNDLLANGYEAGPLVGELLRELHERVLDEPALNTREQLLALLPEAERKVRGVTP